MSLALPVREAAAPVERPEREETFKDAVIDHVELRLQAVEELVQPLGDDLLDRRVGELRLQAPQVLLRGVAERPRGRAREGRSAERRAGKECRSRWSPYH